MKYLVVYDSVFGNTEKVAKGIGEALAEKGQGQVLRAADVNAEQLTGVDLLVAGSPTRGFQPTPPMKEFLKQLAPSSLQGVRAAAFDTRMSGEDMRSGFLDFMVRIFGYAARPIANGLAKKGANLIEPIGGFYVASAEGPLKAGELERAREWAARIAST